MNYIELLPGDSFSNLFQFPFNYECQIGTRVDVSNKDINWYQRVCHMKTYIDMYDVKNIQEDGEHGEVS